MRPSLCGCPCDEPFALPSPGLDVDLAIDAFAGCAAVSVADPAVTASAALSEAGTAGGLPAASAVEAMIVWSYSSRLIRPFDNRSRARRSSDSVRDDAELTINASCSVMIPLDWSSFTSGLSALAEESEFCWALTHPT